MLSFENFIFLSASSFAFALSAPRSILDFDLGAADADRARDLFNDVAELRRPASE